MDKNQQSRMTTEMLSLAHGDDGESVLRLIREGASINACGKSLVTPMHVAARMGNNTMIQFLLDHGADINAKTKYGNTPLHLASANRNTATVQLLIDKGADLSVVNDVGHTAAQRARNSGARSVAKIIDTAATITSLPLGEHVARLRARQTAQTWEEGL